MPTVLAYLGWQRSGCETGLLSGRRKDNLSAEVLGFLGSEDGGEGDGVDIAVGVGVRFVVAAGECISAGSEDTACPEAIAGGDTRERLP